MNDLPQNELLSAYLDGELTAEEQAQVERLLAESPQARQLLDELRALGHTLQSLPQYALGEDISAQVLRAAERQMLTGGIPGGASPVPQSLPVPRRTADGFEPRTLRSTLRGMLSRRALMWTAIAVVAAIFFALQDRQASRLAGPVALKEEGRAERTVDESKDTPENRSGGNGRVPAPEEAAPALVAAPEPAAKDDRTGIAAEGARGAVAPVSPRKMAAGAPSGDAHEEAEASRTDGLALDAPAAMTEAKPAEAKPAEAPPHEPLRADDVAQRDRQQIGAVTKNGALRRESPSVGRSAGGKVQGWDNAKGSAGPAPSQGVWVVQCEITPEAAREHAVDRLLAREKLSREPAANELKRDKDKNEAASESSRATLGDLEVVAVQATAEQLQAALERMAAAPEQFLAVSVEPNASRARVGGKAIGAARGLGAKELPGVALKKEADKPAEHADQLVQDESVLDKERLKLAENAPESTAAPGLAAPTAPTAPAPPAARPATAPAKPSASSPIVAGQLEQSKAAQEAGRIAERFRVLFVIRVVEAPAQAAKAAIRHPAAAPAADASLEKAEPAKAQQ